MSTTRTRRIARRSTPAELLATLFFVVVAFSAATLFRLALHAHEPEPHTLERGSVATIDAGAPLPWPRHGTPRTLGETLLEAALRLGRELFGEPMTLEDVVALVHVTHDLDESVDVAALHLDLAAVR